MVSPLDALLLIALGRLFIFLWSKFPLPEWVDNSRIGQLHKCTLCSGVWIYSVLFIIYNVDLLSMLGLGLPSGFIVGEILSGGAISYIMFLLEIGFRDQFMSVVIE